MCGFLIVGSIQNCSVIEQAGEESWDALSLARGGEAPRAIWVGPHESGTFFCGVVSNETQYLVLDKLPVSIVGIVAFQSL